MERADVAVELPACGVEPPDDERALCAFGLHADGEGLGELREHFGLAGLTGVELETEGLEADLRQARVHDIERGLLLGDEEDAPSVREVVGDEVGNRLRLAGAGWSVQDERLAAARVENSRELGGVGAERAVEVRRVEMRRDRLGREDLDAVVVASAAADEVIDERVGA